MKSLIRSLTLLSLVLTSLFTTRPALAFPPLPSGFYGKVIVDGVNVPDGTVVTAFINGQAYANTQTQTYQGDSVYSLDVMGDDSSTTAIEGGSEGDTIVFKIGEEVADQSGTWKSGTNINLDLSVNTQAPNPEPVPTNTQSGVPFPEETTVSPTTEALYLPGLSGSTQDTPALTTLVQPTPGKPVETGRPAAEAKSGRVFVIFGVLLTALILGFFLWLLFVRKSKA